MCCKPWEGACLLHACKCCHVSGVCVQVAADWSRMNTGVHHGLTLLSPVLRRATLLLRLHGSMQALLRVAQSNQRMGHAQNRDHPAPIDPGVAMAQSKAAEMVRLSSCTHKHTRCGYDC